MTKHINDVDVTYILNFQVLHVVDLVQCNIICTIHAFEKIYTYCNFLYRATS